MGFGVRHLGDAASLHEDDFGRLGHEWGTATLVLNFASRSIRIRLLTKKGERRRSGLACGTGRGDLLQTEV
jgi:hypothetical protein